MHVPLSGSTQGVHEQQRIKDWNLTGSDWAALLNSVLVPLERWKLYIDIFSDDILLSTLRLQ